MKKKGNKRRKDRRAHINFDESVNDDGEQLGEELWGVFRDRKQVLDIPAVTFDGLPFVRKVVPKQGKSH